MDLFNYSPSHYDFCNELGLKLWELIDPYVEKQIFNQNKSQNSEAAGIQGGEQAFHRSLDIREVLKTFCFLLSVKVLNCYNGIRYETGEFLKSFFVGLID